MVLASRQGCPLDGRSRQRWHGSTLSDRSDSRVTANRADAKRLTLELHFARPAERAVVGAPPFFSSLSLHLSERSLSQCLPNLTQRITSRQQRTLLSCKWLCYQTSRTFLQLQSSLVQHLLPLLQQCSRPKVPLSCIQKIWVHNSRGCCSGESTCLASMLIALHSQ